jgi:predicted nuclease of predicted toxin-antitoxin system
LPLRLLADESLDFRIVTTLRNAGFETISVLKDYQGISDREVLNLARQFKAILITEDSDFGEWVFAHREKAVGVIFLRYKPQEVQNISAALITVLTKYGQDLYNKFVVITPRKIRMRTI